MSKQCLNCQNEIINSGVKFCSQSCSAIYNNKLRNKKIKKSCLNCGEETTNIKYCSYTCGSEYQLKETISKIENGDLTLDHRQYKKYLINKFGEKCMECNWCEVNEMTGKIPVELEHIDGNSENNSLDNLKLLCPNCHSLTPTYKALNIGNGRYKRKERYKNGKSF